MVLCSVLSDRIGASCLSIPEPDDTIPPSEYPHRIESHALGQKSETGIYRFRPTQLILPLSLVAVGTAGVYESNLKKLNRHINNGMNKLRGSHPFRADDYLQYLPVLAYIGLDFTGVKAKHPLKERLAAGITAYAAMAVIVNGAKYTIREPRPNSGSRNSFPSGHSATVFTGAELIRIEYGTGIGIGAYAVATGVAFLRLYNGRHWLNDVIAGAGIGILSARIGYWMLPVYRRWFKWDRNPGAGMAITPGYDFNTHAFSLSLVYCH